MLNELVKLLHNLAPNSRIHIESFDSNLYPKISRVTFAQRLAYWVAFEQRDIETRFIRLAWIVISLFLLPYRETWRWFPKKIQETILSYDQADVVILAPGGYLRSQPGISQTFNLFLQCLPFLIARTLKKMVITAPISVGPFAYRWQERFVVRLLGTIESVTVRESYSFRLLERYGVNAQLSTDLVFHHEMIQKVSMKQKQHIVGIVLRKWFNSTKDQQEFEQKITNSLLHLATKYKWIIQPIVQVHAPEYGDNDLSVTNRISNNLIKMGLVVESPIILDSVDHAENVYTKISYLITVRLHAALLALRVKTPVLALSYEHKANGIFEDLGLGSHVVPITSSQAELSVAIENGWNKRQRTEKTMEKVFSIAHKKIQIYADFLDALLRQSRRKKTIPTVTVGICAYNEEKNIVAHLSSIQNQREDLCRISGIWLISDGSNDQTIIRAKSVRGPYPLRVIHYKERKGKSYRLNQLYQDIHSTFLVQTDADVVWESQSVVSDFVRAMELDSSVGMCGGNPQPFRSETFIETGVNATVSAYLHLRQSVRKGQNIFSADGRILAFRRKAIKHMRIPYDMIANDRFAYYWIKNHGWGYRFIQSSIVRFRSPQTIADQIRQNTRFLAAPTRMKQYFPEEMVNKEERIPFIEKFKVYLLSFVRYPIPVSVVFLINRYCYILAYKHGRQMNALWAIAETTKDPSKQRKNFK